MSVTMYGQPGTVYAPLGGPVYPCDGTGLILGVADKDKGDLLRAGCVDVKCPDRYYPNSAKTIWLAD